MTLPAPRGLTYAQAMAYLGVKRRTFDEVWRPHLVAIPAGSSLIFDREDLDRLFERFKREACPTETPTAAANDSAATQMHNGPRNGRPANLKGANQWAKQRGVSTPAKTEPGKLTNGGAITDFASAASAVLKRQKDG